MSESNKRWTNIPEAQTNNSPVDTVEIAIAKKIKMKVSGEVCS